MRHGPCAGDCEQRRLTSPGRLGPAAGGSPAGSFRSRLAGRRLDDNAARWPMRVHTECGYAPLLGEGAGDDVVGRRVDVVEAGAEADADLNARRRGVDEHEGLAEHSEQAGADESPCGRRGVSRASGPMGTAQHRLQMRARTSLSRQYAAHEGRQRPTAWTSRPGIERWVSTAEKPVPG